MTASAATIAVGVDARRPDDAGVFVLASYDAHQLLGDPQERPVLVPLAPTAAP